MVNVAHEYKLTTKLDGVVELIVRHSGRNDIDSTGERDPNTGGNILYVAPRVMVELTPCVVLRIAAHIPTWKNLYGLQREKVNADAGITLLFN